MDASLQPKKTKFAIKNEAANGLSNLRGLWPWRGPMSLTVPLHSSSYQCYGQYLP